MSRRRRNLVLLALIVVGLLAYGFYRVWWVSPRGEPLAVAAVAPDFSLSGLHGSKVSLRQLLSDGPAVLVFYRGHW